MGGGRGNEMEGMSGRKGAEREEGGEGRGGGRDPSKHAKRQCMHASVPPQGTCEARWRK
jgi:hypothetical protein